MAEGVGLEGPPRFYTRIPDWVWYGGVRLSPTARLVLIWYINSGILETGWVQHKQAYVAKSCGISLSALCAKHRELAKAGLIRVLKEFGKPSKVVLVRKEGQTKT